MKFKNTIFLGIFVVLLAAYVYFVEIKIEAEKEAKKEKARKVFLIEKEDVTGLTINKKGTSPIIFRKTGDTWNITRPVEYKADQSEIDNILSAIKNAEKERIVSDDSSGFSTYGLDQPEITLEFSNNLGKKNTLFIGNENPTGSYVFIRKDTSKEVLLTNKRIFTTTKKNLYEYRDKTILDFDRNKVNKFIREKDGEEIILSREFGEEFEIDKPISTKADGSEVMSVFNSILNGKVKEFIDEETSDLKKYGLDNPYIKFEMFIGENNAKKSLLIGKKVDNKYFAKDDSKKAIFKIDSSIVAKLGFDLFDIRDKSIVEFKTDSINVVEVIYPDSTIRCEKDTAGNWNMVSPEKAKAIGWKVRGVITDVKSIKAEEFLEKVKPQPESWGLVNPEINVKFYKDDKVIADISFGKKEDEKVYICNNIEKKYYKVKANILEDLKISPEELKEE